MNNNYQNKRFTANYGGNGGGYAKNAPFQPYGGQNRQQTEQIFKKSGCSFRSDSRNGKPVMFGWNVSKKGLLKFVASPAKDEKVSTKSGKDLSKWVVSMRYEHELKDTLFTGFYNHATKKLSIPDLQLVANPNAPSGVTKNGKRVSGYFGTAVR